MEENEKEQGAKKISRRDFLKSAGLVVGGVATGMAAGCNPATGPGPVEKTEVGVVSGTPKPVEVTGLQPAALEEETSVIRGSSFFGLWPGWNPDQGRGKERQDRQDQTAALRRRRLWAGLHEALEDRGKGQGPGAVLTRKTLATPLGLSYKKRVYSPNRIRYPLKRVDWEPGGDPAKINPQNRGISKYKRISWDEATTIIASELKRIQEKYGYLCRPGARAMGTAKARSCTVRTAARPSFCGTWVPISQSSYTLADPSRRQLGRLVLGRQACQRLGDAGYECPRHQYDHGNGGELRDAAVLAPTRKPPPGWFGDQFPSRVHVLADPMSASNRSTSPPI